MRGAYFGLSILLFHCCCLEAVNPNRHAKDPSVPDETDMSVIEEFMSGETTIPNRGSIEKGSENKTTSTAPDLPVKVEPGAGILKTKDGEDCKCVKYYMCKVEPSKTDSSGENSSEATANKNGTETNNGEEDEDSQKIYGVVDIRTAELRNQANTTNSTDPSTNNTVVESLCESYFDICCPLQNIKVGNGSKDGEESRPKPLPSDGHKSCGHRNENGVGFKMTGATKGEAQFGEFPWTVALIQMETNEDNLTFHKYVGGGSLLHPQVVLTVAHNVLGKNRTTLRVRLGEWDTQTNEEPYPSQERGVKKVIIHDQFFLKTLYNDIAILILDEEARIAPNVDTICLPPLKNKNLKFDGQMCFSAGWGKDHFGAEGRYSEIMKKVSVPVVSKDKCQELLSKSEKLPKFRLNKSFMCAGGAEGGEDTCKGDGGSALVCSLPGKDHKHYVQVGAVSWGLGCGSTVYPAVYTDIQYFTPWILSQMDKEGMSTEYCSLQN